MLLSLREVCIQTLDMSMTIDLRPYLNTSTSNLDPLTPLTQYNNIQLFPLLTHTLPQPDFWQFHIPNLARRNDLQFTLPIRTRIQWGYMNRFRTLPNKVFGWVNTDGELGGCC
jgi:hypothetical protein